MGIFDRLKNAILGTQLHAGPVPKTSSQQPATPAAPSEQTAAATPSADSTQPAAASAAPSTAVDVEAVLSEKAALKSEKLNWKSSIVDLMKLVDLDPSLENRKTLASELGYSGSTEDSAAMNTWLHKQVMQQLGASGGKVPDSLRH